MKKWLSIATAVLALMVAEAVGKEDCRCSGRCRCSPASVVLKTYRSGSWLVYDTANFQVCCMPATQNAARIAEVCESLRADLRAKWLPTVGDDWTPRCQIIVHSRPQDYVSAVGRGASSTVGSSEVKVAKGTIQSRRIDLRADKPDYLTSALPHELTHVVLADCFKDGVVPLWADEGMAILADPADKQQKHARDLGTAVSGGNALRTLELLTLDGYPPSGKWAGFYGQSASLVSYLVSRDSPARFVQFVQRAMSTGYDAALREVYDITNVGELDQRWRHHLHVKPSVTFTTARR